MKILAFGIAKDIVGGREVEYPLQEGMTVLALKQSLLSQFPQFEKLKSMAIAVNNEYAEDELVLSENDEVVIIPPVSGG